MEGSEVVGHRYLCKIVYILTNKTIIADVQVFWWWVKPCLGEYYSIVDRVYFSLVSVRQTAHLEYGSPRIMGGKSRKSGGMW